jgi:phage tail P2-like protein
MRLDDLDFKKLLPLFMRREADDVAIADTITPVLKDMGIKVKWMSDWAYIDELPEDYINALAWELDVDWYNPRSDKSLEVRKELIKSSDEVHRHLGTKQAVKTVCDEIFGENIVEEWFEYSGTPGHFRIITRAVLTPDIFEKFKGVIEQVKRTSAHLDEIVSERTHELTICTGAAHSGGTKNIILDDGYDFNTYAEHNETTMSGMAHMSENVNIIL